MIKMIDTYFCEEYGVTVGQRKQGRSLPCCSSNTINNYTSLQEALVATIVEKMAL